MARGGDETAADLQSHCCRRRGPASAGAPGPALRRRFLQGKVAPPFLVPDLMQILLRPLGMW